MQMTHVTATGPAITTVTEKVVAVGMAELGPAAVRQPLSRSLQQLPFVKAYLTAKYSVLLEV
jgi:hypothetical protein